MKYYIWILGCQYNEWDGARIKYALSLLGLEESAAKGADIIIILSCSVRQTAIDRILGRVKNWRDKKIFLTGCVLEADRKKFEVKNIEIIEQGNVGELIKQVKELLLERDSSAVLGMTKEKVGMTNEKRCHSELTQRSHPELAEGSASVSESPRNDNNLTIQQFSNLTNLVPIMIGCNNFCAYCAVPFTRGREKSRDFDEIVNDVKALIEKGESEIILLGQNVNSYKAKNGKSDEASAVIPDLIGDPLIVDPRRSLPRLQIRGGNDKEASRNDTGLKLKTDFTVLLETLNSLDGDFTISFTSNHPKDMSDDIINAVATLPKIKKAIHLPLQSGNNKLLKAMNRPYTIEQYLNIVDRIKKADSKIEISTDVIVGFPGETEEDFQTTVDVLKQVKYSQVFINKYSPRQGTKAYDLGDPISWEEKQRRWNILNDIAYHKKY